VPQGWTPDQIKQFQDYWDTEFAGDLAKRRRAKFVPGEAAAKVVQTKEPQHKDDFDEWLARIICFAFSVPPQWATKAMNRATADNQSAQSEEEGLEPTKEWVKDLIDEIVAEEFASPDLELHWLDEDEGDPETVLEGRLKVGALTLNEMRDALGLDPFDNATADRPMVLTATGFVPIEANAGGEGAKTKAGSVAANRQTTTPDKPSAKLALVKAGTDDPEHPGWPAGSPGGLGGKFRPKNDDGAAEAQNGSSADSAERAGRTSETRTRYAALETGTRTDTSIGMDDVAAGASPRGNTSTGSSQDQYAAITVERYDRTGDQLIDRTTDILFQTLLRYADLVDRAQVLLGKAGPALYGTLVHVGFAIDVKAQNLPGIGQDGVEQSFSAEDVVKYGANGSIRTDVIMKDASGQVIAIWDVKTGNAELTDDRRQEIREEIGVPKNIPVIELHVSRGVTHWQD
jgi:hypothetical protein